jgi:Initiator Replication protein
MLKMNKNTDLLILKHDEFRSLSKFIKDIEEHRIVNSCLSGIWQGTAFDIDSLYPVDVVNYANKSQLDIESAYIKLKTLLTELLRTIATLPTDRFGTFLVTTLISDFTYDDLKLELCIRFNKSTIPLISGQMPRGCFSYYDSRMDKVATSKKYILAEYLQSRYWEIKKYGLFKISVQQLRLEINLENEYCRRTDFINKLIKPTLIELEEIRGDKLTVTRLRNLLEFTGTVM